MKIGDKVRSTEQVDHYGEVGTIVSRADAYDWHVEFTDDKRPFNEEYLELVEEKEEKPMNYIVIFDEVNRDPHKLFVKKKEMLEWLEEALDDQSIINSSIRIYKLEHEMSFKHNISVRKKYTKKS